jgi:RNA polymerase sigma-70 factor (ECF subfamily)
MSDAEAVPGPQPELERYRSLLRLLAQIHLDPRLKPKLDPSDLVQETFAQAYAAWQDFRGTTVAEREAWLRAILARTMLHAVRKYLHQQKCNVNRERPLEQEAEHSSMHLADWLAAEQSSPSQQAVHNEQVLALAVALDTLPEAQREALVLQHWQGLSLAEIGAHLGRTPAAVAGLIKRGMSKLREKLDKGGLHESDRAELDRRRAAPR